MTPRRRGRPGVSPSANHHGARRRGLRRCAAAALAAISIGGAVGCVQDPMPFDPKLAQAWESRTPDQMRSEPLRVLPTTQQTRYRPGATTRADVAAVTRGPDRPTVKMSLREIIHRAVANNLDVRVAGFDTAIDETRVLQAEAAFDPQFFSDVSFQRVDKEVGGGDAVRLAPGANVYSNNASSGLFQTFVSRVDEEALTQFDAGFRQNLSSGGRVELSQSVDNSWFYPIRSLYNPYYENELVLTLEQPLLQNFGTAVNQAQITIARNTQRIDLLEFRKTTEETVLHIEQAYWELVQAQRDLETDQRLVAVSEQTAEVLFNQQRLGQAVSATDITQANAQTDARRYDLIAQQQRIGDLSDQLKVLMNDPAYPVSGAVYITPADDFLNDPLHFDVDDLIEAALKNRYELGEQQVRIDSAEIAVNVARNGLLPSLTLNASYTVDGLSRTIQGAFNDEANFNHNGFELGLQFQLPIGNRAARAVWKRSLLQRMQAIAGYGSEVEKVTADVKTAARAITSGWQRLYAAHNSVLGFRTLLRDLDAQVKSGNQPLTYEFVYTLLQDQDLLATEERAEHQAQNDYNYALAQLEQAKGTLLRYDNVMLEQDQLPFDVQMPGQPDPRPTPPGYPFPDRVVGPLGR